VVGNQADTSHDEKFAKPISDSNAAHSYRSRSITHGEFGDDRFAVNTVPILQEFPEM